VKARYNYHVPGGLLEITTWTCRTERVTVRTRCPTLTVMASHIVLILMSWIDKIDSRTVTTCVRMGNSQLDNIRVYAILVIPV
jgi:hypothetical protein